MAPPLQLGTEIRHGDSYSDQTGVSASLIYLTGILYILSHSCTMNIASISCSVFSIVIDFNQHPSSNNSIMLFISIAAFEALYKN